MQLCNSIYEKGENGEWCWTYIKGENNTKRRGTLLKGQNYITIEHPREENGHTDLSKDKYIITCKDFRVTL